MGMIFKFLWRVVVGIFILIWNLFATTIMAILVMAGMAVAGYYLLDYLVSGEEVVVPSVYGMTKAQAMERLLEADLWLNPDIQEITNQNIAPGIIIEQRPQPEEWVKKRRSVTVTVSAGAREIDIPDVTGNYADEALLALRSAGLDVGQQASVYHERIPERGVIAQDPQPGRRRSYGNKVNLLVSLGALPMGYVMPNYLDQDADIVMQQFAHEINADFKPEVQYIPTPDSNQWNVIIEQRPQPGTRVTLGEKVVFKVGSSGTTAGDIQMIQVNFTYPTIVFTPSTLSLLVWDESARVMSGSTLGTAKPSRIPVQGYYPGLPIDYWVPVMGNTCVMLAEVNKNDESIITKIHDTRWYHINTSPGLDSPE